MNNFNNSRYLNYAKWDLTINRKFYTNMFIVLAAAILSIVLISFMLRWGTFEISKQAATGLMLDNRLWRTTLYILIVGVNAVIIMSACLLHPLRNKQGRITHFTLPATTLEKYAWHFTICIFGTIVAFLAATAICDGLNALASYFTFGPEYTGSLLGEMFRSDFFSVQNVVTATIPVDIPEAQDEFAMASNSPAFAAFSQVYLQFGWTFFCSLIFQTGLYAIFNSIIYKYNIPITYILQQIAEIIIAVVIIAVVIIIGMHVDQHINMSDDAVLRFFEGMNAWMVGINILSIVCGIAMWIGAYLLYKKGQLTTKFNK